MMSTSYHGAGAVAHGEDVLQAGGEHVPSSVLDRHDVEGTGVPVVVVVRSRCRVYKRTRGEKTTRYATLAAM